MKTPLTYQITEYDCGTTTFTNMLRFLFDREDIAPGLLKQIFLVSLDSYDENKMYGQFGTSRAAVRYLSQWLVENGKIFNLNLESEYLEKDEVQFKQNSKLISALKSNTCIVLRLNYGGEHYVLAMGIDLASDCLNIFDPYDDIDLKFTKGIKIIENKPYSYNRQVPLSFFDSEEESTEHPYALGPVGKREAAIFFKPKTL